MPLFTPEQVAAIIAFLFPKPFWRCEAPAGRGCIPAWDPQGHAYKIDDRFTYQGVEYRVIQNHTSAAHWTPDAVPSLYAVA